MQQYAIIAIAAAGAVGLIAFYTGWTVRRWTRFLGVSLAYHRENLSIILNDPDALQRTRDLSSALIWVIDRDLARARKGGHGLDLLWRSLRGEKTALQITGGMLTRIIQYRWSVDPRIMLLLNTLLGTILRLYLVYSPLRTFTCLYMDMCLICSRARKNPSSESRLFWDIASGRL